LLCELILKLAILTATDIRHRYFVNALRKAMPVGAVVFQDTGYMPAETKVGELDAKTASVLKHHFDERTRQETAYFGHDAEMVADSAGCRVFHRTTETLNGKGTVNDLNEAGIDTVVVYGTSLIKSPLIDSFGRRMINMHLGLSPYYRGTATNFYPLVNGEPEYVGLTIHHIDPGIDSGDILHQGRPVITAEDLPHTVGCKTILIGIELMIQTLRELEAGTLTAVPQWKVENPRLYLRKDYHPEQVVRLYEIIEAGLFRDYAARRDAVEAWVRLVP
jgi:methionyl-tRNA formyltransferase